MKLATWNLNSIRMRTERLLAWIDRERPDVLFVHQLRRLTDRCLRPEGTRPISHDLGNLRRHCLPPRVAPVLLPPARTRFGDLPHERQGNYGATFAWS